jgi:hypothetical protein
MLLAPTVQTLVSAHREGERQEIQNNQGCDGYVNGPDQLKMMSGLAADRSQGHQPKHASQPAVERALVSLQPKLTGDPAFGPGTIERARTDKSPCSACRAGRLLRQRGGRRCPPAPLDHRPGCVRPTGARVLVGGRTFENIDYFNATTSPAPYVIVFVLALTFVLLTIVFRSLVIAGTTVVLSLLSVGAAHGLLVLVCEHGVAHSFFGFQQVHAIEPGCRCSSSRCCSGCPWTTSDITRRTAGHLRFGFGPHVCVSMAIGRMEGEALLKALAERVSDLQLIGPHRPRRNNSLRGLDTLPLQVTPSRSLRPDPIAD